MRKSKKLCVWRHKSKESAPSFVFFGETTETTHNSLALRWYRSSSDTTKVLVLRKNVSFGLNLGGTEALHLLEGLWRKPSETQIIGRCTRRSDQTQVLKPVHVFHWRLTSSEERFETPHEKKGRCQVAAADDTELFLSFLRVYGSRFLAALISSRTKGYLSDHP